MYLKKTWKLKNRIVVKKYHTARYGVKGEIRKKRVKPTKEEMQKVNERNARNKLLRLIWANFEMGDAFLTLTFADDARPKTAEEVNKTFDVFARRMRTEYRKAGYEFKWIMVAESMNKYIHLHMIVNDIPKFNQISRKCWKWGGVHTSPLWEDGKQENLAEYMLKETSKTAKAHKDMPFSQRYRRSRNLVNPDRDAKVEIVKASSWRDIPTVPKDYAELGYVLDKDSIYAGVDAWGYPFQEYAFVSYGAKKENKKRTAERTETKTKAKAKAKAKAGDRRKTRGKPEVNAQ